MGTDIHGVFQRKNDNKWEDIPSNFNQDRHYLLFAWLGNVRNGFGFAGIPTHIAIEPLTDHRGFPDDFGVDPDYYHPISNKDVIPLDMQHRHEENEPLWMGDHSHSWVSADEVVSAHLPTILRTGIITKKAFIQWDGETPPDSYLSGISGPKITVSTPSDITDSTTHVQVEWLEQTSESLRYFVDEMKRLKDKYGDVRFVFGFDS